MIVLDTDILSLLDLRKGQAYINLAERLNRPEVSDVYTTIVSFEEQMRGWLAVIASANDMSRQVRAYERLHRMLRAYHSRPLLDFDTKSATVFQTLRRSVRIGTLDLRIASIALAHDALLVTRNLVDFRKVPQLRAEDWTQRL
jgi:tRNA(fMet)-specific endonuclease VapC